MDRLLWVGGLFFIWLYGVSAARVQLSCLFFGVGVGGILVGMEPVVLYEDEYLVAIDKPAGLVVHRGVGTDETLVDWILERYPAMP